MAAVTNLSSVMDFPYSSSIMSERFSSSRNADEILRMSYEQVNTFLSVLSCLLVFLLFISFSTSMASFCIFTSLFLWMTFKAKSR